jgi:hypothetical protein
MCIGFTVTAIAIGSAVTTAKLSLIRQPAGGRMTGRAAGLKRYYCSFAKA